MAFVHPTVQKNLNAATTSSLTPPPAYIHDPQFSASVFEFEEGSEDEDGESLSTIHLRIKTPLIVTGDHNLIGIDTSVSASKIATAVVGALRQMSVGGAGVPMIDEEGRPRPIKVSVLAGTRVDGNKNVVGEKAFLAATVGAGGFRKKGFENAASGVEASALGTKRQRAESEPIEVQDKRVRTG